MTNLKTRFSSILYPALFLLIFLLGLGLRLYHLGAISLWYDEVGVAMAAMETTLAGAIGIAKEHAAAMPLDYIVAWFAARLLGHSEWALRLAPALWSTFSLVPIYFLVKKLTNRPVALLTCLLTAISPFAILFAQELRFYSALLFFYYLTVWLMVNAIQNPTWKNFLLWGMGTTIGIYFHVYVSLAICSGLFYLYVRRKDENLRITIKRMLITLISIGFLALPGYLYFCHGEAAYQFKLELTLIPFFVMQGIGLLPYYSLSNLSGWIYYALLGLISITGIYIIFRKKQSILIGILISSFIQILIIIAADAVTGYFFAARQIFFLLPIASLIAALVIYEIAIPDQEDTVPLKENKTALSKVQKIIPLFIVACIVIFSVPVNIQNYQMENSESREISELLAQQHQSGETIFVIPSWNALSFEYYLTYQFDRPDIASELYGTSSLDLTEMDHLPDQSYLIINANYMDLSPLWMEEMKFEKIPVGKNLAHTAEMLFTRK